MLLGPVLQRYGAGDKEGAVDSFLRWAIGQDYRTWLDPMNPGAFEQMVADADTFFGVELPSLQEWYLTREDARRITQPVLGVFGSESASMWPGWQEIQERLSEWLPQSELFVLPGANHALEEKDPRCVAEAMVPFLARHPMPTPLRHRQLTDGEWQPDLAGGPAGCWRHRGNRSRRQPSRLTYVGPSHAVDRWEWARSTSPAVGGVSP
jgi:hypothetical protein